MTSATWRNTPEWRAQTGPDRVKVRRSLAIRRGDTSPGCRKLQEGIVVTTVLICDDRRSVREGLTRVMSAVPGVHRIDCVAHGDELLARFSRQPVDVVLVGTQRAVPTGVEATRRLVAARLAVLPDGERVEGTDARRPSHSPQHERLITDGCPRLRG